MALIDRDNDDAALLAAEDAAIAAAANPTPEPSIPLGADLEALIGRLHDSDTTEIHSETAG